MIPRLLTIILLVATQCLAAMVDFSIATERFRVRSVEFEGNHQYSDAQLYRLMVCRPSRLFFKSYYLPELLEDDVKNIENFYHQEGFLEARITDRQVSIDSLKKRVDITLTIEEGQRTHIESVSILGNEVFSDSLLLLHLPLRAGMPLQREKINKGIDALLSFYADHGYLDAEITPDIRVDESTHRALVDLYVSEGVQYRIGEISIRGLEKTKEGIVLRELLFRPGEVINYSRLLKSQQRLYLTGLFKSVYIKPVPSSDPEVPVKDIIIELQESMSIEFNFSVGYGTVERFRTRVELFNHNILGTARKIAFTGKWSWISKGLEISYSNPWTFGLPARSDVSLFQTLRDEPGFTLNSLGGNAAIGYAFFNHSRLTLSYRHVNNQLSKIKIRNIPPEVRNDIRSLTLTFVHDSRNNPFNPSRGNFLEISNETGRTYWTGANNFVRINVNWKHFRSVSRSIILAHAGQIGWMQSEGGLKAISIEERFYTGGPNSLRAFNYQKVGPLDKDGNPLGGRLKVLLNLLEFRYDIYKSLGAVTFVEAGNVWSTPADFKLSQMRLSVGAGLRLNTPVGLARVDLGINPTPKTGEPSFKIYFSMGHAF